MTTTTEKESTGVSGGAMVRRLYVPVVTIALVVIIGRWAVKAVTDFDPLTVAQNARLSFQENEDVKVVAQATGMTPEEAGAAAAVLKRDEKPLTPGAMRLTYVGNSQTLAIMDRKAGDLTSPQWLEVLLAREKGAPKMDVRLASLPRLTMSEMLIELVMAGEKSPRRADVFMGGIVLDAFRGIGVRDELIAETTPEIRGALARLVQGNPDLAAADKALDPVLHPEAAVVVDDSKKTRVQKVEDRLNKEAGDHWAYFRQRDTIYAQLTYKMHGLRNHLMHITSSSARPVPEAPYRTSLELIELAQRYAKEKNIHMVIYLAPIRPVTPNPNDPAQVKVFRKDMGALCGKYGSLFLDYVDLVPETLWTNYEADRPGTEGQKDFAHFTGGGHKVVAEQLTKDLVPVLAEWGSSNGQKQ